MNKREIKYPIELVVALLCDKWKFIILCKLRKGTKRFGELQNEIGNIIVKVLTSQLKELERSRFIKREVYSEEVLTFIMGDTVMSGFNNKEDFEAAIKGELESKYNNSGLTCTIDGICE